MALARGVEARFVEGVRFLDLFSFRYVVSGGHASRVADAYIAQAKICREDPTQRFDSVRAELEAVGDVEAPDDIFATRLADLEYEGGNRSAMIRHLLTTLDDYDDWYRAGAVGRPSPSTVKVWDLKAGDIDHIYPQTPLPAHVDLALESVKHNLGNLAFLEAKVNRATHNSPFSTKRTAVYARPGQAALTRELGSRRYPVWTLRQYRRRTKDLMARTFAVYRL
jgi:hypothetical protein